jgi:hypothetical protein
MSPLTQEIAEHELARASITEEADEWIGSGEEEEDASASASASVYFDASAAFAAASEDDDSASAIACAKASAYFDASAAFAAASISTSALGARLREKAKDLNEALVELQTAEPRQPSELPYEVGDLLIQYLDHSAISAKVLVKRIQDTS